MEEGFYATVKLVNGEELISKVFYCNDGKSLLLDHPRLVEPVKRKNAHGMFHLKDWIKSSYNETFAIDMSKVLTVDELDERIQAFYLDNINPTIDFGNYGIDVPANHLNQRMGYVGSVKETKKLLEEIFKKS